MGKEKIVLIRNGVRLESFNRSYNYCRDLVYLGRFIKSKDINTLISAFKSLVEIYRDLTLTLIGDGPEKNNIVKMIEDLGLENMVRITGLLVVTILSESASQN